MSFSVFRGGDEADVSGEERHTWLASPRLASEPGMIGCVFEFVFQSIAARGARQDPVRRRENGARTILKEHDRRGIR